LTRRQNAIAAADLSGPLSNRATEGGQERTFIRVAALVDTNVLVYRFDNRFPNKQKVATEILRRGIRDYPVRLAHQAIVEFIAAVTRPAHGYVILEQHDALREAEEFLRLFEVLYPNDAILRTAIRGCAAYQLSWFDAHMWAYAEHHGLEEIITEDLQHDRLYGTVRIVNPFVGLKAS
jgi:predicted nucleic acid-binding protein